MKGRSKAREAEREKWSWWGPPGRGEEGGHVEGERGGWKCEKRRGRDREVEVERKCVITVVVERSRRGAEWRRWGREGDGGAVCVQRDEGESRAGGGGGRERGRRRGREGERSGKGRR